LAFALAAAPLSVHAADDDISDGMADKATHGFVNLGSGWMEIPMQIAKGYQRGIKYDPERPAASRTFGTVQGVFKGVVHAVGRTILGVYQLVGFWAANPEDNAGVGIPMDGEYSRDWGHHHGYPYREMHRPMKRKLDRGGTNIFTSPIEVPYQVKFGHRKRYRNGTVKGVWFMLSRFWAGTYETSTFLFPSPRETEGYAFDQEVAGKEDPSLVGPTWDKRPWLKEESQSGHYSDQN
jgi:putative exosortase-associated protein (TIGR04073 family)